MVKKCFESKCLAGFDFVSGKIFGRRRSLALSFAHRPNISDPLALVALLRERHAGLDVKHDVGITILLRDLKTVGDFEGNLNCLQPSIGTFAHTRNC